MSALCPPAGLNQPHSPWRHRGVLPFPQVASSDMPYGKQVATTRNRMQRRSHARTRICDHTMYEGSARLPTHWQESGLGRTLLKKGHSRATLRQKRCGRCHHWPNMAWGLTAVAPRPYMQAAKTAGGHHMAACASPPAFYSILPCCVTHENQQHLHSKGTGEQGKGRRRVEPQAIEQILLQVPPLHPETHQQPDGTVWKRPGVHLQACPENLHNDKGQDK